MKIRLALVTAALLALPSAALAKDDCYYKAATYSEGSAVCQSGTKYMCEDGTWRSLSLACSDTGTEKSSAKPCTFNGSPFSSGATSCQAGTLRRCADGEWNPTGMACEGDVAAARPPLRTCMIDDGSTVAANSTICKSGVTFLCSDGQWRNLGTPCQ